MACDVYLYDNAYAPLSDPGIQIYPSTRKLGLNIGYPMNNSQIGQKWGARLLFATQQIVYEVTAHDPNGSYTPVHMTNLNGAEPGTLEVVMFPKAQAGSQRGSPPQTASNIAAFIALQPWSEDEKTGVGQLVRAIWEVRGTNNAILRDYLTIWQGWLVGLGIDPALI